MAYGVIFTLIALRQKAPEAVDLGQPVSIKTALLFADTHSTTVAVASLVTAGKLSANEAVPLILASLTTNTITKIVLAILSGNWL